MKVLILTSVVSNNTSYAAGDKVTLSDADANKLINGGFALKLVEVATSIFNAALSAGQYTLMSSPSGVIPTPSGGFYWDSQDKLHLIHPSGAKAIIDPLHCMPGWSP